MMSRRSLTRVGVGLRRLRSAIAQRDQYPCTVNAAHRCPGRYSCWAHSLRNSSTQMKVTRTTDSLNKGPRMETLTIDTARSGGVPKRIAGISSREWVYRYVRDEVLTCPKSTGLMLSEQALANDLGLSRTPVREALLQLHAEDLIDTVSSRGFIVAPIGRTQLVNLLDLRRVLETHAVDRVLEIRFAPIASMRQVLAEQRAVNLGAGHSAALQYLELDRRFHQYLVDAAGSDILSRAYARLRIQQLRAVPGALCTNVNRQRRVCDEHLAIVNALDDGDETRAVEMVMRHLDSTKNTLLYS
ncbi:GntR family transcriptional regulator [Rhodococcus sp. WS4]|nr:GntR family transcriptional regulator [Rhodococcus sp. WS4]